ncbi:MAG: hypothetical protein HY873_04585 [Chloroflexi bacterium]|nr:hypothetical protein [Chloroflexota bacterium]
MRLLTNTTRHHPVRTPLADDAGTTMFDALGVIVVLAVAVVGLAFAA